MKGTNKKTIAFVTVGVFALVGAYNAIVINSDSYLSGNNVTLTKRLDEVLGVTIEGRKLASEANWKKLAPKKVDVEKVLTLTAPIDAPHSDESIPAPAVTEDLTLNLVEVINPKIWEKGLTNTQFNGSIATHEGVIESLEVSLPNGASFSASFSELTGNVFEYDMNGEHFSGMMYQVDQKAYMVTLTNGPLEGTRFRFSADTPAVEQEQTRDLLAEQNLEIGNFGSEITAQGRIQADQEMQAEASQAQGFIF